MKQLILLFILSCSCLALLAQNNQTNYVLGYPSGFNANVDRAGVNTYNLSFAFGQAGNIKSFLTQHNGTVTNWAVEIKGQGTEVAVSDHVVLPSGETAVTGVVGDLNAGYEPFIALFSPAGNLLTAVGYKGFLLPFSATHQIVYDEANDRLLVCGSNRVEDPFQFDYSSFQSTFVLSVDASNPGLVHWCSFMDSGPGAGGLDFDLAENILILNDGVFVTGSTNDGNSGDQLVMYAYLDLVTGNSMYSNSVRVGSASFGAGADAIDTGNSALVMANTDAGLHFLCIDTNTGDVISTHRDNTSVPINATLYGYDLIEGPDDGGYSPLTVAGYLIGPGNNPVISPFFYDLNLEGCHPYPTEKGFYFVTNNTQMPQFYHGAIGGGVFINTPGMAYKDNTDLVLAGYDDNGVAVSHFDYGNTCNTACVDPLPPTLITNSEIVAGAAGFSPKPIGPTVVKLLVSPEAGDLINTCNSDIDCPPACPITVTPVCGIDYQISAGPCIPSCYNPQYDWSIYGLSPTNYSGQTITVRDLGGTYSYLLTVTYTNANGDLVTCYYEDELIIPDFDCSQLQVSVATNYLYNMEYQTDVTVAATCIPYTVSIAAVNTQNNCTAGTGLGQTLVWDAAACGAGPYLVTTTLSVSDGTDIAYCTYTNWVGVQQCSIEPPVLVCQERTGTNSTCGFSDNVWLEIFPNQINVCYQYQWVLSPPPGCVPPFGPVCPSVLTNGPSYIHCDENTAPDYSRISLRITDTCTGCVYFYPSIAGLIDEGSCGMVGLQSNDNGHPASSFEHRNSAPGKTSLDAEFSISPNPTQGWVYLSLPPSIAVGDVILQVLNNKGQLVQQLDPLSSYDLQEAIPVDLSQQPAGLYYIRYTTATRTEVKPVVVSH